MLNAYQSNELLVSLLSYWLDIYARVSDLPELDISVRMPAQQ